jgi:hypothetical protein
MPVRTDIEIPANIARLPIHRGFPVPWFVDDTGDELDFRVVDNRKLVKALQKHLCWVCGRAIFDTNYAYVAGPMCAINRTSAEPPSHVKCAVYSARAGPVVESSIESGLPLLVEASGITEDHPQWIDAQRELVERRESLGELLPA